MPPTSFSPTDVARAWNGCHSAFYQVAESDVLWNMQKQQLVRYRAEELAGVPVLLGEAAPEGVALGIAQRGLWLSLFGPIPDGGETAFAAALEGLARAENRTRLALCSDEFHFLPGVPSDDPAGLRLVDACKARGFSVADCADFLGDPGGAQCEAYCDSAREELERRAWTFSRVETDADREAMTAFLTKEFSGRWLREWKVWGIRNDTSRAFWNLLRDEKGTVLGFSRLAVRGLFQPESAGWTPGALRLPLSVSGGRSDTDSCLGPIGISASERGRGAGKILLGLSLRELVSRAAKRTCIDWTNAYNYYTPLGFEIARRYLSVWKDL